MYINVRYRNGTSTKIVNQHLDKVPTNDDIITMLFGLKEIVKANSGLNIIVEDWILSEEPLFNNNDNKKRS